MQEHEAITTWHVATRLPVPIHQATVALDALVQPHDDVAAPLGRLSLRPLVAPPGLHGSRRLHGDLRVARLGPKVRVELELRAWSRDESELGMRPAGARPPRRREEPYFTAALGALAGIQERVVAVAVAPAAPGALLRAS